MLLGLQNAIKEYLEHGCYTGKIDEVEAYLVASIHLVLVRKQSEAMDGDIVVALVANENTLKRYFVDKENQKIRRHPENKTMKDIIVSDCKIQGVAVKVIKNLE